MPLSSVVGAQSIIKPGVCTSSTRPAVPYVGQWIYETDTSLAKVWDGSAWSEYPPAKANLASPAFTGTPTAPTAAAGTNTTQIATMASKPWNTAWGSVGFTNKTTNTAISSGTTVMSQAFTSVTGRLYKITHYEPVAYNSSAGYTIFYIKNGATLLKESFMPNRAANEPTGWMEMYVGTFTAGSITINIVATSTNITNTNNSASASSHLLIEDIGPA